MRNPSNEYSRRASLWPFRALFSLAFLAAIAGTGYGLLEYAEPAVSVFIGFWAAFVTLLIGVLPAGVVALFDAAFVGPRPARRVHWRYRAQLRAFSLAGACVGLAVGAAYGFTYHHTFAQGRGISSLVYLGAVAGTTAGLVAGRVCGLTLRTHPGRQSAARIAMTWATAVASISYAAFLIVTNGNATLIPGAVLALIGAGVVPQVVATRPVDSGANAPPPPLPPPVTRDPSPGPHSPEGGPGEGERVTTGHQDRFGPGNV